MKEWIPSDLIPYNENGALTLEDQYYLLINNINNKSIQIEKNSKDIDNLNNIVTGMVDNFVIIGSDIKQLKNDNIETNAKIVNINNDITEINNNINTINNNIATLTTNTNNNTNSIATLTTNTNNNTNSITDINKKISTINQNIVAINDELELLMPITYDIDNVSEIFSGNPEVITAFNGSLVKKNNIFTFNMEISHDNINQIILAPEFCPITPVYTLCGLDTNDSPVALLINQNGQFVVNTKTTSLTYLYITLSYTCNGFS